MPRAGLLAVVCAAVSVCGEQDASGGRELADLTPSELGRGFGRDLDWRTLSDGLAEAAEFDRPVMLVLHKSWCSECRRLGEEFATSRGIERRADSFVLVNCMNEDPGCESSYYMPDGGYVPRILFLDSGGRVLEELTAPGGVPQYKYFYSSATQVVKGMDRAAKALHARPPRARNEL
eukprot:TRINITY_DN48539_c0_g1_i1.p1 TRINITY_DN48539_c0_g1~~TRINITY_DN48539_c0_g1_i1.p1  ORF type:complete len:177 (+),score=48.25 TRINITY_DN48539_c0_g1_i1:53-583(+)